MRQKSYHDKGTAPRHFEVGDYVYLKVSPTKGVQRFGVKGKLAPRYIGPYEVIEVCGPVAYRIQLTERFSAVHNVFHVTQLKKGMPVPQNEVIIEANALIELDFSLIEHPLKVLDQKERKTQRQTVRMYKIQWSHHTDARGLSARHPRTVRPLLRTVRNSIKPKLKIATDRNERRARTRRTRDELERRGPSAWSSRTVRQVRTEQKTLDPESQLPQIIIGFPKRLKLWRQGFGDLKSITQGCYSPKILPPNSQNHRESRIL
jgi:hypothetical protein